MLLAKHGNNVPKEWKHNEKLYNNDGNTVAMFTA